MGKNTWSEEDTNTHAQNLDGVVGVLNGLKKSNRFTLSPFHLASRMAHIFMERAVRKPWLRIDWIYKWTSLHRKQMRYSSFFNTFHEKLKTSWN
jgi:hypothetical protein